MEICQIMKTYAIERNSILVFIFFDVLGQFEVRRDIKEDTESIKEDVKNVRSDMKSVEKIMKEDLKYIKKDIIGVGESIKETVKESVQSIEEHMKEVVKAMNEVKNKEQPEMKEDYIRTPMENTDRDDSTNLRALHLRELHLVGFNFALNIKLSA